jgi:sporulation protein YunB
MKSRYFKKRQRNKRNLLVLLTIFVCIIIWMYYIVERNLKPTIYTMSENKARIIATQAITEAASQKITESVYKDLVTVMTDKDGKVTMLKIDPVLMNKLAAETTSAIQTSLSEIETKTLKIPIVNLLGSQLLANTGPSLSVKIQPIGSVKVDFKSDAQETGINMTRHRIYLYVETDIRIVAPLIKNDIEVVAHVPISETLIVNIVSILKYMPTEYIYPCAFFMPLFLHIT